MIIQVPNGNSSTSFATRCKLAIDSYWEIEFKHVTITGYYALYVISCKVEWFSSQFELIVGGVEIGIWNGGLVGVVHGESNIDRVVVDFEKEVRVIAVDEYWDC